MNNLRAIVYVSSAVRALDTEVLDDLLRRARARNLEENITGFLLYCGGNFMQYIEGPAEPLARVYALIRGDPLHHDIIELLAAPVTAREFAGWAMAYSAAQMRDFSELSSASWGAATPNDPSGASQGRRLLRDFWQRNRRNLA